MVLKYVRKWTQIRSRTINDHAPLDASASVYKLAVN